MEAHRKTHARNAEVTKGGAHVWFGDFCNMGGMKASGAATRPLDAVAAPFMAAFVASSLGPLLRIQCCHMGGAQEHGLRVAMAPVQRFWIHAEVFEVGLFGGTRRWGGLLSKPEATTQASR